MENSGEFLYTCKIMPQNLAEILTRGVEAIYPSREAFEAALKAKKLTIYHGIDPTASSLHLGHLVVLRKLHQLQDLGHKIILLIGDFTARIGDPSQKLSARRILSREEVLKNAKDYKDQAAKVLKFSGKNPAVIKFNSTWLSKLNFENVLKLMANFTVQQLLERDMFQIRIKAKKPINFTELVYPLMQGYDSVALDVDAEIGGTDQTFNMLIGRQLLKKYLRKEKFVVTCKLLTVGEVKMGKTESVFIPLSLTASDMFGKIMAQPDTVMSSFFELLTDVNQKNWQKLAPIETKKLLGGQILTQLFSAKEANLAKKEFEKTFQQYQVPQITPTFSPRGKSYGIINLLIESKLVPSKSEAKRLISQGAIEVDKVKILNLKTQVKNGSIIRIGKYRFLKII